MTRKVVVTDANYPDLDIERSLFHDSGFTMEVLNVEGPEDIVQEATDADALITQYVPISERIFEKLPDLKVVGRYGIGVDNIDVASASNYGVQVVNDPTYCIEEVATHAVALLLSALRRLPGYGAATASGEWDWATERPIYRLSELTLGLVAFGHIAQRVAEAMRPFGVDIVTYDPYVSSSTFDERRVESVSFNGLCHRSDAISVHAPLTDETSGLFDADAFADAADLAAFVNTSRGDVVDSEALAEALEAGDVGYACVDVVQEEPPVDSVLADRDDVLVTPHCGWYSESSITELRRNIASGVVAILQGESASSIVNEHEID